MLLPVRTVGVMGDARTYDYVLALRAVTSTDGMTADYYSFDHEFLGKTSTRLINEVRGVNRVVYDITSKPLAQSSGSRALGLNQGKIDEKSSEYRMRQNTNARMDKPGQ